MQGNVQRLGIWYGINIKLNWHILEKNYFWWKYQNLNRNVQYKQLNCKNSIFNFIPKLSKTNKYGLHKYKVFYSNPILVTQN